ncbi:DUF2141 domain-containing protein [Maribacter litopenaei]|uniref:DUF2141 domain-containing protein n=1 Tax=Maribacter litopenaei TaxID=2976127 RepID=A0ABY5Y428_9FLAO|nr:DUF2141 domain-containing protein [Maribacter litopenaei]UWX53757.1 DUF2141 domain-containing protein [Maribacter litopenaei]
MKCLFTIIGIFWLTLGVAQTAAMGVIELEITGMENDEGQMLVGLYNSEEGWLLKPYKGAFGKIANGVTTVIFRDIPEGVYAISVFHDKDNDGKLNRLFGLPTERFGASNNAPSHLDLLNGGMLNFNYWVEH